MKIACIGKGGSGKTTLCGLLAREAAASGRAVVAYDADVNQHLGNSVGVPEEAYHALPLLGREQQVIKEYLRGDNRRIDSAELCFKTTPPGTGSRLISAQKDNLIYQRFSAVHNTMRLLRVGGLEAEDVGLHCFHGKSGIVELLLSHTIDTPQQRILVDATAGTDALASGLAARVHAVVLVVEPTLQSVRVYAQIAALTQEVGVPLVVVANKVDAPDELDFIIQNIGHEPAAAIPRSRAVRRLERGETVTWSEFEQPVRQALHALNAYLDHIPFEWEEYEKRGHQVHLANARSWINAKYGIEAEAQIDPIFSLKAVVDGNGRALS